MFDWSRMSWTQQVAGFVVSVSLAVTRKVTAGLFCKMPPQANPAFENPCSARYSRDLRRYGARDFHWPILLFVGRSYDRALSDRFSLPPCSIGCSFDVAPGSIARQCAPIKILAWAGLCGISSDTWPLPLALLFRYSVGVMP